MAAGLWTGRRLGLDGWLLVSLLVAVSYVLAGRVGQLFAAPPNYATPFWPPSGIALAAALLLGNRIGLGIFVGAMLTNGWTPWFAATSNWEAARALLIAASISCGATLQALLAAHWIRRWIGFPNPLIQDRQILAFLGIGGPLACMVGATWGVATLAIAGNLEGWLPIAMNWWNWWVGDVIGVILFTPLLLIVFAPPRKLWRPRWVTVALPLIGVLMMIVIGMTLTHLLDSDRANTQFARLVDNADHLLQSELEQHLEVIDSLRRFYNHSAYIDRAEFSKFIQDSVAHLPATAMVAWVPRKRIAVAQPSTERSQLAIAQLPGNSLSEQPRDDRVASESLLAKSNGTSAGAMEPPPDEVTDRFTVTYLFPEQPPFLALGDDLASNPNWRMLMRACCDSGEARVASAPFLESDDLRDHRHALVLSPIYVRDAMTATVEQRRENLRGFLLVDFDLDALILAALPYGEIGNFERTVTDITDPESPRVVHTESDHPSPHKSSEVVPWFRRDDAVEKVVNFAGRNWVCRYRPTVQFHTNRDNPYRWLILASGLGLTGILGTFLLINSGRTAQVEASEARYLDLYENAPDMFLSLDVRSQRVIECNQTFLDSTGFGKNEVMDKPMELLFDPESRGEARRAYHAFLLTGHVSHVELRLCCKDGSLIDTSLKMSAAQDEQGESIVCRASLRDITARKRVEADLKTRELELTHAARLSMMGEMATGLAHEINQPLAAISAYAEGALIRLRDGKPDPDRLAEILQRIDRDAHRAGQIIRRLRQFLHKRTPERVELKINEMVREVAQFVDADLRRRDVRIGVDLEDNLPPFQGDPIQIQQVLVNLIRNSCDAMGQTDPARRQVIVRTSLRDDEGLQVSVEDCGHGLASTTNEQLFDAFYSTKDDGLGMGLAISRSIIESHGGQIWATSNRDGGASFHFSLPIRAKVCAS